MGYGNVPPSRGRVSSPIGPGQPKNQTSPNNTKTRVVTPIGPGATKNKAAARVPMIGGSGSKAVSAVNRINAEGSPKKKASPKFRGLPGREGSVTPGKSNSGGTGKKGTGTMKAAGYMPPSGM